MPEEPPVLASGPNVFGAQRVVGIDGGPVQVEIAGGFTVNVPPPPPPEAASPIPTLAEWARALMVLLLLVLGVAALRPRPVS